MNHHALFLKKINKKKKKVMSSATNFLGALKFKI